MLVGTVKNKEDSKMNEQKQVTLDVSDAIRCIRTYYNETVRDEHGRYMSWRHCYNAYGECRGVTDDKTIDYLSLHLAFI